MFKETVEILNHWNHSQHANFFLDKNLGVRSLGTGEALRRIVGGAVMTTFRRNILVSGGDLQFCADYTLNLVLDDKDVSFW